MATEYEEDRLRELLRDDAWSLPSWPDAGARVRRTARRQRLRTASASVATGALAAAAIVLPLKLVSGPAAGAPAGTGGQPAASHSVTPASSTPSEGLAPPVGAPGFPILTYPPPRLLQPVAGARFYCPDGSGVRPFGKTGGDQAMVVLSNLGRSLARDLHLADRAFWPAILGAWQGGGTGRSFPGVSASIQYVGPLVDYHPGNRGAGPNGFIAKECGSWLAASTWLIVAGPGGSASWKELLFIDRSGHVLLYYAR